VNRSLLLRTAAGLLVAASLAAPSRAGQTPDTAFGASRDAAERTLSTHALRMLDGSSASLASLRGHVVVVHFWATWCAPCRRELPRLAEFHRASARQDVRMVAVSIDEERENVARFLRATRVSLPVAVDGPEGLAKDLDLRHVPATVVLDRTGHVAWTSARSDDAALAQLASVVHRLGGEPGGPAADAAGGTR
jgi:thiol-disulfide isomerase/thioredoxin